jgi:DNA-binding NarL/FixJ family response regulator
MSERGSSLRVMIVDDHPLVRSAGARALTRDGMTVVAEAATGEEAIAIATRIAPDILLLDIALPGMSGVHVVRELAPRLPATRIVMLTASSADRDVADAMRYGASGYLTKDLSAEALARSLRAVGPADSTRAGRPSAPRGRPRRSRHRRCAHDLAPDGGDAREQHPAQARRAEPLRSRAPLPRRRLIVERDGGAASGGDARCAPDPGLRGAGITQDENPCCPP